MIVSAIVAAGTNGVIGKDNELPWHLSGDLKYFKRKTLDHHVIMGKNTFFSIGFPLPKRTNIVLTRDPYFVADGIYVAHSVYEALEIAYDAEDDEVFIIGGAQVYHAAMNYLDKIYLTRVDVSLEGDVYFPALSPDEWKMVSEEKRPADDKNDHDYSFRVYERLTTKK
jgi:dihydrofolate reductase